MYRLLGTASIVLMTAGAAFAGPGELIPDKVMDFGTTPKGAILVHYFRFTNTTKQTIHVGTPRVSCGCVTATMSKHEIAPGETAAVVAYMDTRRIPTPNITKTVTVYVPFVSPMVEEVALRVQTVTRDDLMMSPDTLAFGTVTKGEGGKLSTKVTFMSDPNWTLQEAVSSGGFVKTEFKEVSRQGSMVTYDVTAMLDKSCPVGNWTSTITLGTSNAAVTKLRLPVTVNVVAPVAVSPENIAFGELAVGASAEQKIVIQSGAGTPFKILEVRGGDEQLKLSVDNQDMAAQHTIIVAANPTAPGGFTRQVEIVTDNKMHPTVIVPITAKVVGK